MGCLVRFAVKDGFDGVGLGGGGKDEDRGGRPFRYEARQTYMSTIDFPHSTPSMIAWLKTEVRPLSLIFPLLSIDSTQHSLSYTTPKRIPFVSQSNAFILHKRMDKVFIGRFLTFLIRKIVFEMSNQETLGYPS